MQRDDLQMMPPTPAAAGGVEVASADRLVAGECGLICDIEGIQEDIERLKVMGLCLGRRLHVIKAGDPMIVSVMGTRLGIARDLAACVSVRADVGHFCVEDRSKR